MDNFRSGHVHLGALAIDGRSSSGCFGLVDAVVSDSAWSPPLGASTAGVGTAGVGSAGVGFGSSPLLILSKPCALAFF